MTAVKLRIQDLVEGTYDGTHVHTHFGEVSEARILGTLVDVFITDNDGYISLTVDDGTETVRIKAWGQDVGKLKEFSEGDLVEVVGRVREYNEEIYLTPEVISRVSPNKWILRELELMKLFLVSGAVRVPVAAPAEDVQEAEYEGKPESTIEGEPEEGEEHEPESTIETTKKPAEELSGEEKSENELDFEEIEEFEILGEDEVVETVLELLKENMTKEALIEQSGLDEIDVELALRELLDEGKITKEGEIYRRTA